MLKRGEKEILGKFYLSAILSGIFASVGMFWIVYFIQQGFTYADISIALGIMSVSMFIFEVPTGAIADVYGRKISVLVSDGLIAVTSFAMPFVRDARVLWGMFFIWGIAATLDTGAYDAWVVDWVKSKKKEHLVKQFYVKRAAIAAFTLMIASFIGAMIVKYASMDWLWYLQGVGITVGALILASQPEHFRRRKSHVRKDLKKSVSMIKKGFKHCRSHPVIFALIMGTCVTAVGTQIATISWQPFLVNVGLPIYWLGYLGVIGGLIATVLPFTAIPLVKKLGHERYYLAGLHGIVGALRSLVLFFATPLFGSVAYVGAGIADMLESPVYKPYFQKHTPSKIRATVGSVKSMLYSIATLIGAGIMALIGDSWGPQNTLVLAGLITIFSAVFYLRAKE